MSDLEMAGYLKSPHQSAGRMPTERGIRFFVDTLLKTDQASWVASQNIPVVKLEAQTREGLFDSASTLLSGLTRMAGVVALPKQQNQSLKQLEFLPLSEHRILAVVVASDDEVQNRIIETERTYSASELRQISTHLNEKFAGKNLTAVRDELLKEMKAHQHEMNEMMCAAVVMAENVFEHSPDRPDLLLAGETNLMEYAELSNIQKLRELFSAFSQKRDILLLLDQCLSAEGVQIFIGQESGYEVFDGCSLVTSTYECEGQVLGVLGVIGPTRMAYDRIIPVVDMTAKMLSAALKSR
jgi:heat-inducible transcriptional repressor